MKSISILAREAGISEEQLRDYLVREIGKASETRFEKKNESARVDIRKHKKRMRSNDDWKFRSGAS